MSPLVGAWVLTKRTMKDELEAQRPDHEDMGKTPSTVCMEKK